MMFQDEAYARFIPTHVGNTSGLARRVLVGPVHPHACGEHTPVAMVEKSTSGSSPRMWGTHDQDQVRLALERFIPTHVGNTSTTTTSSLPQTVHPHA